MATLDQTQGLDGKAAFLKITRDAVANVIVYGLAAAMTIGIGSYIRWLGIVLFGIDTLVTAFEIVQVGFSSFLGVILMVRNVAKRKYRADDLWWDLGNLARLVECGFYVAYAVIMYRYFFGPGQT